MTHEELQEEVASAINVEICRPVLGESLSYRCARVAIAAVIERCAEVAESEAQKFLDPQYATPQPMGSFSERFACGQVAAAIRALAPK